MNRTRATALLFVAALGGVTASTAIAQERMRAGLWEMTTTKGGETINSGKRCFTAEEAGGNNGDAKTTRDTLVKSFAKASCAVKDIKVTDKTISYTADCNGAQAHELSSVAEYHGDTMEIQMTVKQSTSTYATITKGHRVGACP